MPQKQQKTRKDDTVSVLQVLDKHYSASDDDSVDPLFPEMLKELLPGGTGMDLAAVRKLLEAGADVEVVNPTFGTPLLYACSQCTMGNGHFKPQYEALVRLLLSFGADANRPVWKGHARDTPLCKASGAGHVEVVRLLLDHGASVDLAGANGTPLCVACDVVQTRARHEYLLPVIRLLLERGASLDVLSNRSVGRRETQRRLTVFQMVRYFGRPVLRKLLRAHLARTIRLTAKRSKLMAPHVARFLV